MRISPGRPGEAARTHGRQREVFMTGKRRIAAAMRHEPVDRVPVMCQLAIGHYLLDYRHCAGRVVVYQRGVCARADPAGRGATDSTEC